MARRLCICVCVYRTYNGVQASLPFEYTCKTHFHLIESDALALVNGDGPGVVQRQLLTRCANGAADVDGEDRSLNHRRHARSKLLQCFRYKPDTRTRTYARTRSEHARRHERI